MAEATQRTESGSTLTVTRAPADGLGDQYPITLRLDGRVLGRLGPGESVTAPIPAGEHRLQASNTLMRKSVQFATAPAESHHFVTRNRSGRATAVLAAMGAGWLYVELERAGGQE